MQRRAVIFIQKWWQWYKIRGRIAALAKIRAYLNKIDSNTVYIEENLYVNLEKVVDDVSQGSRFPEQKIMFDFETDFEICVREKHCEEFDISERFRKAIVPEWLKLDVTYDFYSELDKTLHSSDPVALLHYSQSPLSIVENTS